MYQNSAELILTPGDGARTERPMLYVLSEYCRYFNRSRPHQGLGQRVPEARGVPEESGDSVVEIPVLAGLHHDYRIAA
ncbi:MAG: hypothetical protein ACI8TX_003765 [Hyphomicrobiaceae bacterium]|jgi:hypothetical protein